MTVIRETQGTVELESFVSDVNPQPNSPTRIVCVHFPDMLFQLRGVLRSEGTRRTPQSPFFGNVLFCTMNLKSFFAPRLVATLAADALVFTPDHFTLCSAQRLPMDPVFVQIKAPGETLKFTSVITPKKLFQMN